MMALLIMNAIPFLFSLPTFFTKSWLKVFYKATYWLLCHTEKSGPHEPSAVWELCLGFSRWGITFYFRQSDDHLQSHLQKRWNSGMDYFIPYRA